MFNRDKNYPKGTRPIGYLAFLPGLFQLLEENGYACYVGGSMRNDYDMLAVAWTNQSIPATDLVEKIRAFLGGKIQDDEFCDPFDYTKRGAEPKPNGRFAWTIHLMGGPELDLSIIGPEPDAVSNYMRRMDESEARFRKHWKLPRPSVKEVEKRIESALEQRDWPGNAMECARIGYEVARQLLIEQGMTPGLPTQLPTWAQWINRPEFDSLEEQQRIEALSPTGYVTHTAADGRFHVVWVDHPSKFPEGSKVYIVREENGQSTNPNAVTGGSDPVQSA